MADQIYKVRDPSGNVREIKGPAGATDEQVIAQAQSLFKPAARNQNDFTPSAEDVAMANPAKDMPWYQQALAGVGKAISDTGTGLHQLVAPLQGGNKVDELRAQVAETRQRDAALMNTGAGLAGNIAGNVGMMLLPGGALKAGGLALKAPVASAAGGALLAPKTIAGAAGVGAAMGLAQPSASTKETLTNTGVGAAASAAAPLLVRGYQTLKGAAEPLYEAGKDRIVGRLLNRVAGDEAPAVADRLSAAATPFVGPTPEGEAVRRTIGEIVPGSAPSVGEASGNAGVASLERAATAIEPAAGNEAAKRIAEQNAARIAHVETVAGEPGKREMFESSRQVAADQLYKEAYAAGVDLRRNAATGQFLSKGEQAARRGEITKLMGTPAMQDAAAEAANLMRNDPNLKGKLLDPAGSVQGLDYTRRALSDMIAAADKGSNKQRILINLRDRLDTTLDTISPKYAEARATFAAMSKPINQMDVGEALLEKGVNKVTGKLEPGKYINNLTDKTAQSATGFKGATLERTLDNAQLNKLNAVKEDLQRTVAANNAAGTAGSDTVKKLAYSNFIDAAGVPTWLRKLAPAQVTGNVAARGADALYGRANTEMASKLAMLMRDPGEAARVMRLANQPGNERLLTLIARSGAAAGPVAPALLNAQKQ